MGVELAIAGMALGTGGEVMGGVKAKKAAKKQASILNEQARLRERQAEFEAQQADRAFEKLLGRQKVSIAKSGIRLEDSPLLVLEETLRDKEATIKNILEGGAAEAGMLRSKAKSAKRAGRDALMSSIISGVGSSLRMGQQI